MSRACGGLLLLTLVLGWGAERAAAQNRPPMPPDLSQYREVTMTGKFVGLVPGQAVVLNIKDSTEHPYWVLVQPPTSKLGITGTALPEFLKAGLLVSFTADVDDKGVVDQPVKELQIVSPSETTTPGLFREDRDNKESTRFYVRATIRTNKEGVLTMSAGGKQVQATLASDAKIKVESTDPKIAQEGDEIKLTGRMVEEFRSEGNQIKPGKIFGEKIDIVLAQPLDKDAGKKRPSKPAK